MILTKNINDEKCAPKLIFFNEKKNESDSDGFWPKSAQPLNEDRVALALPEYFIKCSQSENAKSDYFNRFSSKLSFEPSKPKGILL